MRHPAKLLLGDGGIGDGGIGGWAFITAALGFQYLALFVIGVLVVAGVARACLPAPGPVGGGLIPRYTFDTFIVGPSNPTGVSDTPSRRAVFVYSPGAGPGNIFPNDLQRLRRKLNPRLPGHLIEAFVPQHQQVLPQHIHRYNALIEQVDLIPGDKKGLLPGINGS